jgi:glucose/arabinose dehydrogenase
MKKSSFILVILVIFLLLLIGFWAVKNKNTTPNIPSPSSPTSNSNIIPANLPLNLPVSYTLGIFAQGLGGVRDLEFSPGGTLLASITSAGKVVAIPGKNGQADLVKDVLAGLNNPHGIIFYGGKLYVAQETKLVRYNWDEQYLKATQDKVLFNLPSGGRHFTRSIVFDSSGKLYVSIGSTCDVCNESNPFLASIIISDADGNNPQVIASGLRNSVFVAINSKTNEVWATEMGRDYLGDNLPPDEINIIKSTNYGWPNCYGNKIPDTNFNPNATSDSCQNTEPPTYQIQAHSAPLGLAFINSSQFPADWQGDLLVAYHGSWNRSVPDGYKVVHMKVSGNQILGEEDFTTGFLQGSQVIGRPVDLIFDKSGNLYISDDKSGNIYIVQKIN